MAAAAGATVVRAAAEAAVVEAAAAAAVGEAAAVMADIARLTIVRNKSTKHIYEKGM